MRGAVLALVLIGMAGAARADSTRELAQQHFGAGKGKFEAGDFQGALLEFAAADALAPSPILAYDIAVCHEQLGDREAAVKRYREYLTRRPDAGNRAQVEGRIAALGAQAPPRPPPIEEGVPPPRSAEEPPAQGGGGDQGYDEGFGHRVPDRTAQPAPGQAEPAPAPQATAPPPPQEQPQQQPQPPYPAQPQPQKQAKPVYKQWWFWVVVGVGAIVLIDVASSGGDHGEPTAAGGRTNGLTLIKF